MTAERTAERPHLKLVHERPTAWIADATLEDTRAYVESRYRRACSDLALLALYIVERERPPPQDKGA